MFQYSKDNITMASILDTRFRLKTDDFPVKVRITYRRIRRYYPTGQRLTKEQWNQLPYTRNRELKDIREEIENSFSIIRDKVQALAEKGLFSFDRLNAALGNLSGKTINEGFRIRINQLKNDQRIGNMLYYDNVLKGVERIFGSCIPYESVTCEWLKKYENALLEEGKKHTTISMHMRAIRTVMNDGRRDGTVSEGYYPFGKGKYEIKNAKGIKKAIPIGDIKRIAEYPATGATEHYRDLWIFLYLCNGINVSDMIKLRYSDIIDDEIHFIRQKTEHTTHTIAPIRVALTQRMKDIIKKWGNPVKSNAFIFTFLHGEEGAMDKKRIAQDVTRRINKHMKIIGAELGIGNISTYVARHSFATILKNSGAPVEYISESLGHTDTKTTRNYLASFEKDQRIENAKLLEWD